MQTAIITGANRGIGLATAEALLNKGLHVGLVCRDISKAETTAQSLIKKLHIDPKMATPLACDLTDQKSIDLMHEQIKKKLNNIDVLINNAAVLLDKGEKLLSLNPDNFKKTFDTNFYGTYYLTSKIIRHMLERNNGKVIMISSGAGQLSQLIDDMPAYRLSKFSLNGLTKMLSSTLVGTNVQALACDPGWVETDMGGKNADRTATEAANDIVELAISRDSNLNGHLFNSGKVIDW